MKLDDIETMITGDKKKGLEDALKILREFIYSGLEKYFLNEGKAFFSNELNQKNEANFLKSNHIIINMMLEMLACNDLIENEIE